MHYNFLYPFHNIKTIHSALPLFLLTTQHNAIQFSVSSSQHYNYPHSALPLSLLTAQLSQTVLNSRACGSIRQKALRSSYILCNSSEGYILCLHNYIALEHEYKSESHIYIYIESNVNFFMNVLTDAALELKCNLHAVPKII